MKEGTDPRADAIQPLGAPGFEALGAGASEPTPATGAPPRKSPWGDEPGPGWWRRRRCRRAGLALILLSLIGVGIGLESGLDGAQAMLGHKVPGGGLTAHASCGLGMARNDTCSGGTLTVSTLDGEVLGETLLTEMGGTLRFEEVPSSTVRIRYETSKGVWERKAFVPDGSDVHVSVTLQDAFAGLFGDLGPGGDGVVSPRTLPGWQGEDPQTHALGLVASLLAALGAFGGWCAASLTRYGWAMGGAAAAGMAGFFLAPLHPAFAVFGFVALAEMLFIGMAQGQFRRRPTFEGTVVLD